MFSVFNPLLYSKGVRRANLTRPRSVTTKQIFYLHLAPKSGYPYPSFSDESLGEDLVTIEDRSDMDLSDRLWNCLIKVESYAQVPKS